MNTHSDRDFQGISLYEHLPFNWQPAQLGDLTELDHVNHETARALQALAVFEEMPRELPGDTAHHHANPDILHLQAKVDVLLSLVGRLVSSHAGLPANHALILRGHGVEWSDAQATVKPGDSGYASIYPNPMLPLPLRLPARVVSTAERAGTRWFETRFEHLTPAVAAALEKMIFRRHRRQIAFSKGSTGVFTETGVFRASKF